jgi:hypothetical protein
MTDPIAATDVTTTDDGPDRGQPEARTDREEGLSSSIASSAAGDRRLTLINGMEPVKSLICKLRPIHPYLLGITFLFPSEQVSRLSLASKYVSLLSNTVPKNTQPPQNKDRFGDLVSDKLLPKCDVHLTLGSCLVWRRCLQLVSRRDSRIYAERERESGHMGCGRAPLVDRREFVRGTRRFASEERWCAGIPGIHVWSACVVPLHVDDYISPQSG